MQNGECIQRCFGCKNWNYDFRITSSDLPNENAMWRQKFLRWTVWLELHWTQLPSSSLHGNTNLLWKDRAELLRAAVLHIICLLLSSRRSHPSLTTFLRSIVVPWVQKLSHWWLCFPHLCCISRKGIWISSTEGLVKSMMSWCCHFSLDSQLYFQCISLYHRGLESRKLHFHIAFQLAFC